MILKGFMTIKAGTLSLVNTEAGSIKATPTSGEPAPSLNLRASKVGAVSVDLGGNVAVDAKSTVGSLKITDSGKIKILGDVSGDVKIKGSKQVSVSGGTVGGKFEVHNNQGGIDVCGTTFNSGVKVTA